MTGRADVRLIIFLQARIDVSHIRGRGRLDVRLMRGRLMRGRADRLDRVPHNLEIVSRQLKQIERTRILPMGFTISTA